MLTRLSPHCGIERCEPWIAFICRSRRRARGDRSALASAATRVLRLHSARCAAQLVFVTSTEVTSRSVSTLAESRKIGLARARCTERHAQTTNSLVVNSSAGRESSTLRSSGERASLRLQLVRSTRRKLARDEYRHDDGASLGPCSRSHFHLDGAAASSCCLTEPRGGGWNCRRACSSAHHANGRCQRNDERSGSACGRSCRRQRDGGAADRRRTGGRVVRT